METEKLYYERLKEYISSLPKAEQQRQVSDAIAIFEDPDRWENVPVGILEFIDSDQFLNIKQYCWQPIKDDLVEFYKTGRNLKQIYNEAVFDEAIGAGKSFEASLITTYETYKMLCLKNPQKQFKLAPKSKIAFMNMSINAQNAKDIVFGNVLARIEDSPWFKQNARRNDRTRSVIEFPDKNVYIIPGNSKETFPAGYNIFGAVIDESAWYVETKDGSKVRSVAEDIHTAMERRIRSRFGNFGIIVNISSPRYVGDFIERKMEESKTNKRIFARRAALWDRNPRFKEERRIEIKLGTEKHQIPESLHPEYIKNPEKFSRDFMAIPSLALEPYIKDLDSITDAMHTDRIRNIWKQGYLLTDEGDRYHTPYFIHVDLGLNKDKCGIAMVTKYRDLVICPLLCQISGSKRSNREVDFSEVRDLIVRLKFKGFNIMKVSYDGWQSKDSEQILKKKGFDVEILSIDRNLGPYDTLKGLLMERRIRLPLFQPLIDELQQLELIEGKKVDHPRNGSKDIADALAGACYWAAGNEAYGPAIYSAVSQPGQLAKIRAAHDEDKVLIKN